MGIMITFLPELSWSSKETTSVKTLYCQITDFQYWSFPSFFLVITAPSEHPGTVFLLRHHSLLHIVVTFLFCLPYKTGSLRTGSIGHPYLYNTQYLAEEGSIQQKVLTKYLLTHWRTSAAIIWPCQNLKKKKETFKTSAHKWIWQTNG